MGGSSKQVVGYRYYANFLLFIGNAIEAIHGIRFGESAWITGKRVPMGEKTMIYVDEPALYGENEGGVSGALCLHVGSYNQSPDQSLLNLIGKETASGYPLQSYIAFTGLELQKEFESLSEEELQKFADDYSNGIVSNKGFYLGNSGYMKEMLLWPKRIHVKNDGDAQWYDAKAEMLDQNGEMIEQIKAKYSDLYNFSTKLNGAELQQIDRVAVQRFNFERNSGSIKLGIGFIYNSIEDQVFSVLIQSTSGPVTYLEAGGFELIRTEVLSSNDYWPSRKIYHFKIPKGAPGMRSALFGVSFSGNYTDPAKWSEAYVSINQPPPPVGGLNDFSISSLDINPIHKIREILTDRTAMNKPESEINEVNFIKAADRIWDERLGISWAIQEKSCIEALNELCYHIEAGIRVNRQTGLYEVVLFRDDWFADAEIHTLAENKIKSIELEVQNGYEVVNQLNVNFYDRENIKNSSFSVAENASIRNLNGKVNAETVDFPYFMNQRNAEIVAKWKLKQFTSAGWKGSFITSEKQARKWNRYDIVKINWSRKGISNLPVRILNLKFGGHTSNTVTIEFEEVVSALGNLSTSIVIDESIDNSVQPPKHCNAKVFELPYFEAVQANGERETNAELAENPDAGFVCAIAEKPQNNSLNAALHVNNGSGFEKSATINYCETAYLENSISRAISSFVVKNVGNLASVRIGSQIFINDEIMVYQSFDAQTNVLIVKRGALDTVPQNHDADSILFFADDFVAIDPTLYVSGEQVEAKVLTTTPSGVLSLNDAETHNVEFKSRAIRPYPPANVKINGEYYPQEIESDLVLTWVNRNRLQQTGGVPLGWYEQSVTLEPDVEYVLEVYDADDVLISTENLGVVNSTIVDYSAVSTAACKIRLYSVRDGIESLEAFEHRVIVGHEAPYNLAGIWNDATQSVDLTWEHD